MKILIFLLTSVFSLSSFAVCQSGGRTFNPGEYIYLGTKYKKAARIMSIDHQRSEVVVRSENSGKIYVEKCEALYSGGCLEKDVCSETLIYRGSKYPQGAEIVIVNKDKKKALVKDISSGYLHTEKLEDIHQRFFTCSGEICFKDIVAIKTWPKKMFKVIAANPYKNEVTLEDSEGSLYMADTSTLIVVTKYHFIFF